MSISGEATKSKGTRPRVLDAQKRVGNSHDFSKASPSNGQCPTAVSSRNQTIASREIQRPTHCSDNANNNTS